MDVKHFQEPDGGNIEVVGGHFQMSEGLGEAAYYSLFGGNERDSGLEDGEPLQWWGNLSEVLPERRYRSETQHLLRSLPVVPANIGRIEDAATRDLAWFTDTGLATFVAVRVSIPARNTWQIDVSIEIDDAVFPFSFSRLAPSPSS